MQAEAVTLTGTDHPETKRIPIEGQHVTHVRNVSRIVVEVETETPMTLEGNFVRPKMKEGVGYIRTRSRIEVYVDRLGEVMRQFRRPEHEEALRLAERQRDNIVQMWRDNRKDAMRGMTPEQKDSYTHAHCLVDGSGTAEHLRSLGYKTGIPNLLSVKVVSQSDPAKMVDANDWGALTDTEKADFVGQAPASPENATEQSMRMIADVLSRAMGQASAANTKTPTKK